MVQVMSNIELCLWNSGSGEPPTVSAVRTALYSASLSESHAEDIPSTTAFRRACNKLTKKEMLTRVFKKNEDLHVQFDKESISGDGLGRQLIGVYRCHPTLAVRRVGYESDTGMEYQLQEQFDFCRQNYEWADVSVVIQNIIKKCGLGAYSPRKAGGIYFMPANPDRPALLDQMERFCTQIDVRFLRYAVPDTDSQRSEIMDAVSAGIEQDIVAHETTVQDYSDPSTATIDRRTNAIDSTRHLMGRLEGLLGNRFQPLVDRLEFLKTRLNELKTSNTGTTPAGGRRINLL